MKTGVFFIILIYFTFPISTTATGLNRRFNNNAELGDGRSQQAHAFKIRKFNGECYELACQSKDELISWLSDLNKDKEIHDSKVCYSY